MKLINTRSTLPTIRHSNPLAIAVADKYGAAENFIRKFNPDKAGYCARHLPEAIANDCPTMVVATMAYGEPSITALLITHISATVVRMGEEMQMTPEDVRFIAEGILGNEKARLLTMAGILAFFYRMACGEYKIYGKLTPRTFLEAFNGYAEKALATERQLKAEVAKSRERQAQQEHDAIAITYDEYKQLCGIDDDNPLENYERIKTD